MSFCGWIFQKKRVKIGEENDNGSRASIGESYRSAVDRVLEGELQGRRVDRRHASDRRHSGGDKDRKLRVRTGAVQERQGRSPEASAQLLQVQGYLDSGPSSAGRWRARWVAGVYCAERVGWEKAVHVESDWWSELRRRILWSDGVGVLRFARLAADDLTLVSPFSHCCSHAWSHWFTRLSFNFRPISQLKIFINFCHNSSNHCVRNWFYHRYYYTYATNFTGDWFFFFFSLQNFHIYVIFELFLWDILNVGAQKKVIRLISRKNLWN